MKAPHRPGLHTGRLRPCATLPASATRKLRTVADFDDLVLLLGRLVHAGAALDLLPKDADVAAEFAAVDVVPLLMAKLPDTVTRPRVEELLGRLEPRYVGRDGVQPPNRGPIQETLPQLGDPTRSEAASSLVMAVNCRAGLEKLTHRFTPVEDGAKPAADRRPTDPDERVGRLMIRLAKGGTAVWDGDLTNPTTAFERLRRDEGFRHTHACAAPLALCAVSTGQTGWLSPVGALTAYAAHPVAVAAGQGDGEWDAGGVGDQVVFAARPALVDRTSSRLGPLLAPGCESRRPRPGRSPGRLHHGVWPGTFRGAGATRRPRSTRPGAAGTSCPNRSRAPAAGVPESSRYAARTERPGTPAAGGTVSRESFRAGEGDDCVRSSDLDVVGARIGALTVGWPAITQGLHRWRHRSRSARRARPGRRG